MKWKSNDGQHPGVCAEQRGSVDSKSTSWHSASGPHQERMLETGREEGVENQQEGDRDQREGAEIQGGDPVIQRSGTKTQRDRGGGGGTEIQKDMGQRTREKEDNWMPGDHG